MAENEAGGTIVVFVALNSQCLPNHADLLALLWDKYAVEPLPEPSSESNGTTAFFDLLNGTAFYSLIPAPIP